MRLIIALLALGFWSSYAVADPRERDYRDREVRDIQERLIELGYAKARRFEVDGVFGEGTREIIRNFQRDHDLRPADGEAGPLTLAALFDTPSQSEESSQQNSGQQANTRCKNEEISATGDARPIEGWAMRLAKKNWREEVRARYGEEWADYSHARIGKANCFQASVGALSLKRCRIEATPCNPF
jgi:Putative peptidoglycan binding domain